MKRKSRSLHAPAFRAEPVDEVMKPDRKEVLLKGLFSDRAQVSGLLEPDRRICYVFCYFMKPGIISILSPVKVY